LVFFDVFSRRGKRLHKACAKVHTERTQDFQWGETFAPPEVVGEAGLASEWSG